MRDYCQKNYNLPDHRPGLRLATNTATVQNRKERKQRIIITVSTVITVIIVIIVIILDCYWLFL